MAFARNDLPDLYGPQTQIIDIFFFELCKKS